MTTKKIDCTGIEWGSVEWTMLCTLYLRAYESRSERSILADHAAAEVVERIDYDFARIKRYVTPSSNQYTVALRAKQLDLWAADFLRRHPDATVLHLGCGLDSRAFRLAPPATVRWFDIDVPAVIELRRRIHPERDGYRMIGSSVTDPGWLAAIPADRPALVIAEGLMPYLTEGEIRELLQRLTDRLRSGELIFDGVAPWIVRLMKIFRWGIRDGREIERWNPRLRCVVTTSPMDQYWRISTKGYRMLYRLGTAIPAMRRFNPMFRFVF